MMGWKSMKAVMVQLLLRVCPAQIRLEYGAEMEEVFFHCLTIESQRRRGFNRLLIWPRGIWDLLVFAARVRREWRGPEPVEAGGGQSALRSMKMRGQDVRAVMRFMRKQP